MLIWHSSWLPCKQLTPFSFPSFLIVKPRPLVSEMPAPTSLRSKNWMPCSRRLAELTSGQKTDSQTNIAAWCKHCSNKRFAATKGQTALSLPGNISLRVGTYQASTDRCPRNQVICLGTPLTSWRGHLAKHLNCLLALLRQKWIWRALVCLDSKGFCGCVVLQEAEGTVLAPGASAA